MQVAFGVFAGGISADFFADAAESHDYEPIYLLSHVLALPD